VGCFGAIAAFRRRVSGPPTLIPLGGAFTLPENAAAGAVAGSIFGKKSASALSLADDAGGRVALAGSNIVRGATALDYETATSHNFTVRETLAGATNTPRDTVLTLNVTDVAEGGPGVTIPVNTSLPRFVDGQGNVVTNPVCGEKVWIDVGGWTQLPTSFNFQLYNDLGAILDGNGTVAASSEGFYVVFDTNIGHTLRVGVIAINAAGASDQALSDPTAAVVDRALAKPTLTRTTASGVVPMGFSIDLPAGTFAGDQVHIQVCTNNLFGDADITQDIYHVLTEADMQAPFTPDWSNAAPAGLVAPGATDYMRVYIEAYTPAMRVVPSVVSDPISPTDAAVPVTFNPSDKTAGVNLSPDGLTATITGGFQSARATRGGSTAKSHFEATITNMSGVLLVGVADASVLTTNWFGADNALACMVRSDGEVMNGGESSGGFTFTTGDRITVEIDETNPADILVYFFKNGAIQFGGAAHHITGATGPLLPAIQGNFGANEAATYNFGATAFADAPTAGFSAL
jgi:hypothetical protein